MKKAPSADIDGMLKIEGYSLPKEMIRALKWAGLKPSGKTLDVATGAGRMAWCLAKAGHHLVTVDKDIKKLAKTRQALGKQFPGKIKFTAAEAAHLPFGRGRFNNVVCSLGFHEMDAPAACLSEMARVCHPQGALFVVDFNAAGFKVMDKLHLILHGKSHRLGRLRGPALTKALKRSFRDVRQGEGTLTSWWLAKYPETRMS